MSPLKTRLCEAWTRPHNPTHAKQVTLGPHSYSSLFDLNLNLFLIDKGTFNFSQAYQGKQL